jgi:hypothetical protein
MLGRCDAPSWAARDCVWLALRIFAMLCCAAGCGATYQRIYVLFLSALSLILVELYGVRA